MGCCGSWALISALDVSEYPAVEPSTAPRTAARGAASPIASRRRPASVRDAVLPSARPASAAGNARNAAYVTAVGRRRQATPFRDDVIISAMSTHPRAVVLRRGYDAGMSTDPPDADLFRACDLRWALLPLRSTSCTAGSRTQSTLGQTQPTATGALFAVNQDRLTLLYGNNGTGKTSLLRLVFHALSVCAQSRSSDRYVGNSVRATITPPNQRGRHRLRAHARPARGSFPSGDPPR